MRFSIISALFKSTIRLFGQKVVSYKILLDAEITGPIRVDLPINLRGKGKNIKLGRNARIGKNAFLNCQGRLIIKNNAQLHQNTIIYIGSEASLVVGEDFNFGANSIIRTNKTNWTLAEKISISTNCAIFAREKKYEGIFSVGNGSNISDNTIIDVCDNVTIGNYVAIGNGSTIFTHNHVYTDRSKAAWKGGIITGPVTIKDGCWIGANVTIMPGVTIGKRSVIAAGAIVTKDVPDEVVMGGVPAKYLKSI